MIADVALVLLNMNAFKFYSERSNVTFASPPPSPSLLVATNTGAQISNLTRL
jgi:hypothetical protein